MVQYRDLEKAVDYLVDETPEGAPYRDDADLCRLSDRQRSNRWEKRRRFALPVIVRLCTEGRWKATGIKPDSAEREHIPDIAFIDSEINWHTGHLMAKPGAGYLANLGDGFIGQGARLRGGQIRFKPDEWKPVDRRVAIWTELMFSVPSGADEGTTAAGPEGVPVEPLTPAQDEEKPLGNDQSQLSRRDQEKAKTEAKYKRWYQTALEIKIARKDDEPLRPIEIAKMVAKKEKAATGSEVNPETIKRRLNEDHHGWAD